MSEELTDRLAALATLEKFVAVLQKGMAVERDQVIGELRREFARRGKDLDREAAKYLASEKKKMKTKRAEGREM